MGSVEIPKNIQCTLQDPNWKAFVLEEMKALTGNDTWKLLNFLRIRRLLGVIRFLRWNKDLMGV